MRVLTKQHPINIHRNVVPPGQLPGQMMRPGGGPPGGPPGGGGPQVPTSQPPPGPGGKMPGSIKTNIRAANQVHPKIAENICEIKCVTKLFLSHLNNLFQ